jgi:hypothetical protein
MQKIDRSALAQSNVAGGCCKCCKKTTPTTPTKPVTPGGNGTQL